MLEELEQCKSESLALCDRLLVALEDNRDAARSFFAGELYQAYDAATDKAENQVKKIRSKIRNL